MMVEGTRPSKGPKARPEYVEIAGNGISIHSDIFNFYSNSICRELFHSIIQSWKFHINFPTFCYFYFDWFGCRVFPRRLSPLLCIRPKNES